MSVEKMILSLLEMFAGVALFLSAMFLMSTALQKVGTSFIKNVLYRLTKNSFAGFSVGTMLSTFIHSGPVMVLVVSFINVGLLNLVQSIGVILGANVGTTLSMQLLSFDIGKYCFLLIALSYAGKSLTKKEGIKHVFECFFGLGLLFLGLILMKQAALPLKEASFFLSLVQGIELDSFLNVILLIAISTLLTAIMQSSGATVALVFSFCLSGVFTDFRQFYPIILGSHIGTCVVSFIGSIGATLSARRAAYAHLFMNIVGVSFALIFLDFFIWFIPQTSSELVRQAANYHTFAQLLTAIIFLPFAKYLARFLIYLTPDKTAGLEVSLLDDSKLGRDSKAAILSSVLEIRRMVERSMMMFQDSMRGLLDINPDYFYEVKKEEEALNIMRLNVLSYLYKLAEEKLSSYESMLIQSLMTATVDIERIGDYIESLTNLTEERLSKGVWFEESSMLDLMELYRRADNVLVFLRVFFSEDFYEEPSKHAVSILKERDNFVVFARLARQRFNERLLEKKETAIAGVYFNRYLSSFSKLVRHTKTIVLIEEGMFHAPKTDDDKIKLQE